MRFERSQHALPLPNPNRAGSGDISMLWEIINIPKDDRILLLTYIIDCFRCATAFPILVLLGLQDSGKSATQNTIRSLIDPSTSNLRTAPKKIDDLVTEAVSNWLVSYNNVSSLSDDMHDDFCCIATGSGFATRKLHTNTQQIVVNIARPVVINGIYNFIRRPDLLDRAIIIELSSINEEKRKTDSDLNKALKKNLPTIFRGLLDLMVQVLEILPNVTLDKMPRMADFSLLGVATEQALKLEKGIFLRRYLKNRSDAKEDSLESSPIMLALIDYIEDCNFWRGRPVDLLNELTKLKNPSPYSIWPKTPHKMIGELRRYAPVLRQYEIEIVDELKSGGKRSSKGNYFQIAKISTLNPPSPHNDEKPSNDISLPESNTACIDVNLQNNSPKIHPEIHSQEKPTKQHYTYASEIPNVFSGLGVLKNTSQENCEKNKDSDFNMT